MSEENILNLQNQQYLVSLINLTTLQTSTTLVSDKTILGNILHKLSSNYVMLDFQIVNNFKSVEELLKELRQNSSPRDEGLVFGDGIDND